MTKNDFVRCQGTDPGLQEAEGTVIDITRSKAQHLDPQKEGLLQAELAQSPSAGAPGIVGHNPVFDLPLLTCCPDPHLTMNIVKHSTQNKQL